MESNSWGGWGGAERLGNMVGEGIDLTESKMDKK